MNYRSFHGQTRMGEKRDGFWCQGRGKTSGEARGHFLLPSASPPVDARQVQPQEKKLISNGELFCFLFLVICFSLL